MNDRAADLEAIRDLIDRQFASMSWREGGPDAALFKGDFLPGAPLYPAARPVSMTSPDEFAERMAQLARTGTLASLHERGIGTRILVFGNVAVAAAVSENTENEDVVNRSVEMLLLVKTEGHWKVAAQAWDKEMSGTSIPDDLLVRR